MSTEENKSIVRRLLEEGINQRNTSVFDDLVGANYVNNTFPAPARGPEAYKQTLGLFLAGFPDMHITVEGEVGEGDMVSTRGYFTGTHSGEFMGIPPTGKQINVRYIEMWRVQDGKLGENWVQMDQLGMMQQLGIIPEPGQAGA